MTSAERDRLLDQIKAAIPVEPGPSVRRLCLGKRPARKNAIKFSLSTYVDLSKLPTPPSDFGREHLVKDWKMLGNNVAGNCVFAGGMHEHMLWNREAFRDVPFDESVAFADYSALTGYDPTQTDANGYNPTDLGSDMQAAASYRRTVGLVDSNGVRHKILAYLGLQPGNLEQLYAALWLFGSVGAGIRFPEPSAWDQMDAGLPWTPVEGSSAPTGHYIPLVSKRDGLIKCVTWGKIQPMTPAFYSEFCDEAVVYVTDERLTEGKTLDGFDLNSLLADLSDLKPVAKVEG